MRCRDHNARGVNRWELSRGCEYRGGFHRGTEAEGSVVPLGHPLLELGLGNPSGVVHPEEDPLLEAGKHKLSGGRARGEGVGVKRGGAVDEGSAGGGWGQGLG